MEITLVILWLFLIILGFIGDFLPVLPWPIMSYLALLMVQLATHSFSNEFMILMAIIAIVITTFDYIIPVLWTKRMWWTKRGTKWSTIGLIIWVIILPILWITLWPFGLIWLFWGPFLWAYIWERLYQAHHKQKTNNNKALKAAFGSFLGFLTGILLKLVYTIVVSIYFFPKAFVFIKNLF